MKNKLITTIEIKKAELNTAINNNDYQKVMMLKLALRHLYNKLMVEGLK